MFGVFLIALTPLLMHCRACSIAKTFFAERSHTSVCLWEAPCCPSLPLEADSPCQGEMSQRDRGGREKVDARQGRRMRCSKPPLCKGRGTACGGGIVPLRMPYFFPAKKVCKNASDLHRERFGRATRPLSASVVLRRNLVRCVPCRIDPASHALPCLLYR